MALEKSNNKYLSDSELFNTLIVVSSELTWIRDFKTQKITWLVSKANQKKFNIPVNAGDESFWFANIHLKDLEKTSKGFYEALNNTSVIDYVREYRFRAANKKWRHIRDKIRFIRDDEGGTTRVIGVWDDYTEVVLREKKTKQLLRDLEKDRNRFKIISELSNAVMWEEDIIREKLYWTAGHQTLMDFGLKKDDFPVSDWKNHIHPEDFERSSQRFYNAVNSDNGIYKDEYRVIKTDGSIAYVIDRGMIIRDRNNVPVRAIGGWVDVTKQRIHEQNIQKALKEQNQLNRKLAKREEELATSEEELRQLNIQLSKKNQILIERDEVLSKLQHLAKIGTWEYDPNSNIFSAVPEAYAIHGIDLGDDISNVEKVIQYYDDHGKSVLSNYLERAKVGDLDPFDEILRCVTPQGAIKWLRICAWTVHYSSDDLPHVIGLTYDITHFKETEELLKGSEEKFANAFHKNPDFMILVRKSDYVIEDINVKCYPITGYTREEFLGRKISDFRMFVDEADRTAFWNTFNSNLKVDMETEWRRKDGSIVQISMSSEKLKIGGNDYVIAILKNISDRKAAEERFIKAFDLSPDLMLIFREQDSTLIDCNRNIELISGYSREEIIGKSADDFDLWANPEDQETHNQKYYGGTYSVFMESKFFRKDKTIFFGNISSKRITLQGENHMLVVVRDITERKIAEQKIIESEANLYAVINNSNLLIWSVDPESKLIKANRAFGEYISKTFNFNVIQGERIAPPNKDEDDRLRSIWRPRYDKALRGDKYKITEKYEGRHLEFFISPIIDNDQILGVVVIADDITERVEQEMRLKDALNKIVEFKLMALRSVMNPHFFFNALSSIQYFIVQNDRKNALEYLSTFSRLVRGILEHSVSNSITLAEEIEQLRNYIVLEQLRFEEKFDFEIIVDDQLDLTGTEIPSLLIQPYVENAIIHGLYNKESHGHLLISINKEMTGIMVQVTDNGVGRVRARQLREKNMPGHKSMGTAITEERLKLINNQYKVSFEVIDLTDEKNEPRGTTVRIWLNN